MPNAAPHRCAEPSCPALVSGQARCPAHTKTATHAKNAQHDRTRLSAAKRGYDRTWREFVEYYRSGYDIEADDPRAAEKIIARNRCARCGRRTGLQYDHVVPLSAGGERLDPKNIQPLCDHGCHQAKTREDQRKYGQGRV